MSRDKLQPSHDLLEKVMTVADAKAELQNEAATFVGGWSARAALNSWGVYCRVNRLPGGALFYQAGGKFIARLRFVVEVDGSITVRKYRPGDWERNLEPTYDNARFRVENLRKSKEIDELITGAKDTEEEIRRLEQRASEVPNEANYWSTTSIVIGLYREAGRFKDAERAAISAQEAWPTQPVPHLALSWIYFVVLLNAKRIKVGTANEQFIAEYGASAVELTLESLGYTYEQAYTLAERHIKEILRLISPKDRGTRKTMEKKLADLEAIDRVPFR